MKYDEPWAVDPDDVDRTIAIIDSGIFRGHPEFNHRDAGGSIVEPKVLSASRSMLTSGGSFLTCDCDPSLHGPTNDVADRLWHFSPSLAPHGTVVSGIAAAYGMNGQGLAGTCWDCSLLVLRVSSVVRAVDACSGECVDFCSNTPDDFQPLIDSIRYAAGWTPPDPDVPGDPGDPVCPEDVPGWDPEIDPACEDLDQGWFDQHWAPVRARVISISLVSPSISADACNASSFQYQLRLAVEQATARGCVIVVMAGNSNNSITLDSCVDPGNSDIGCQPLNPITGWPDGRSIGDLVAVMPQTITVGGVCRGGQDWHSISRINPPIGCIGPCGYEWYDAACPVGEDPLECRAPVLSVVVPIDDILSTYAQVLSHVDSQGQPVYCPGGADYGFLGDAAGTSWAPPQVAGVVALMLKANPFLSPAAIKTIINTTATDIGPAGYDRWTGYGLLNAQAAVQAAMIHGLPANFNGDDVIDPLDAIDYLLALGTGDVMADLDLDAAHTSDDLTIFLNSYTAEE